MELGSERKAGAEKTTTTCEVEDVTMTTSVSPRTRMAQSLDTQLVAHCLVYAEARSIGAFACSCAAAAGVFGHGAAEEPFFRRHWAETLSVGDRLDAMDVEGRWFEADVVGSKGPRELELHYRSWNASFDQSFDRTSPRLAPLFTHCRDWRPLLRRGQLIEAKSERCWYLAIVLNVHRAKVSPSSSQSSQSSAPSPWICLDAVGVNSYREDDTLRVASDQVPNDSTNDLLRWHLVDYDSEDIAPLGTHIRPGDQGKHYTTNRISMPMSLLIDLMR